MCLLSRAVRVATQVAAVVVSCLVIHSAQGAIRDGGIDPSNLGKGDWIYILPNAINHMGGPVSSVTNLESMMIFLKNQGLRYIIIKAATGPTLYPSDEAPQFTAQVVNAGHAAGLWVFGYNRSDGIDIPGEIAVADYVFNVGADGFVFDAEIEWESSHLADNKNKAIQLCSAVRNNWPTKFLAHSPFPIISYHSSFPYKEFGYYCDAVMPQDYWIEIGVTPTYMVSWMTSQWKSWQNGLTGVWTNAIKPIVGAGQGWSSASGTVTGSQITEFFTALKNQVNPATAGGYKGANFWRAELHPLDVWAAISNNMIGVFTNAPVIDNVSSANPTANSITIHWTTDQSSDSVVEYGLDTSYGTNVTNNASVYYHTVNLSGLTPYTTYYFRVKSKNGNNQTGVSGVNVFATTAVTAPDVIVESRSGGLNYAVYSDTGTAFPNSWFDFGSKSTAPGVTTGIGARYNSTAGIGGAATWFQVHPTLPIAGGRYDVYVTIPSGASAGANVVSTITMTGCTGLPATTSAFSSGAGMNTWNLVGTITNNPGLTAPTVRFDETANDNRFIADAVKFVYVPTTNPPAIVTQPVPSQTIVQGSAASFSVVASGSPPLYYQWRRNGADISGAIMGIYTRNNVQSSDAGSYSVVITNSAGAITSSLSVLTVVLPARITVQPTDATVRMGSNVQFTVTATGTPTLSYQWQMDGTNLTGATASSLTIPNAQSSNGGSYAVLVTNLYDEVLSSIATLTVLDPYIVTQPQDQTVGAGGTANFTASANGTLPLSYQWRKEGNDLVDGPNISGAHTPSLTVMNVQGENMGYYSMAVSNVNGWAVSSNATLTAPFAPVIVVQPANQKAVAGSPASLTVGAAGPSLSYRWRRDGTNLADGGKISGATTATLVVSNLQAGEVANYSVLVTNTYGQAVSSNAILAEWPLAAWGHNVFAQTVIPGGMTDLTGIAAGDYHSLALKTDGTVAAWGAGATWTGSSPYFGQAAVPEGLNNVVAVAAGGYHSLALKGDGTVVGWGAGTNWTGTTPNYGQAVPPAGLTDVVSLAGGSYHSLALRANGTVVAWGAGTNVGSGINYGQAAVPDGLTGIIAVAGGDYHSLALKSDHTVVGWGAGTSNTGVSPNFGQVMIPANLSNVTAIAAGRFHSVALKSDGTVMAWGYGASGQTNVPADLTNAVAIAARGNFCLALKADGTLVGWGDNSFKQTNTPPLLDGVTSIAAGAYHALALQGQVPPYFIMQPSSQVATAGQTASLTVLAFGSQPMTYQWQHAGTNVPTGTDATLTLASVQSSDAGDYAVLVTNPFGSTNSSTVQLTVVSPPAITTQPESLTLNLGSNATFSVVATGDQPLSYQWVFAGTNISNATASSYTRSNAQAPDAGTYAVVLTNSAGSVTSQNATLTFNVPPTITTHPQSATVSAGASVTFSVVATGTAPLGYQWKFGASDISGATGTAYTLDDVQAPNAGTYSVVVSNIAGIVTSGNAVLAVEAATQPRIDAITSLPDGRFQLQISGGPGDFAIECAPVLPGLTQLSTLTATGSVFQYIDPETNQASRFYRVKRLSP